MSSLPLRPEKKKKKNIFLKNSHWKMWINSLELITMSSLGGVHLISGIACCLVTTIYVTKLLCCHDTAMLSKYLSVKVTAKQIAQQLSILRSAQNRQATINQLLTKKSLCGTKLYPSTAGIWYAGALQRCDSVWSTFPEMLWYFLIKMCLLFFRTGLNFQNFLKSGNFLKNHISA